MNVMTRLLSSPKKAGLDIVLYFRICLEGETAGKKDKGRLKANEKGTLCLRLPMS